MRFTYLITTGLNFLDCKTFASESPRVVAITRNETEADIRDGINRVPLYTKQVQYFSSS